MALGWMGFGGSARVHDVKKGQMFSTELVLASAIFITGLIVFVSVWNSMLQTYFDEEADRELQTALLGISDMAVLSSGQPSSWEASALENASAFGLASSPNVISPSKASALQSLNASHYNTVKERMGAGRFGVFMSVNNSSSTFYRFGTIGDSNDSTVKILRASRLALLNNSVVTVNVQVWRTRGKVV